MGRSVDDQPQEQPGTSSFGAAIAPGQVGLIDIHQIFSILEASGSLRLPKVDLKHLPAIRSIPDVLLHALQS